MAKAQRIFAFSLALIFLFTTLAITATVIWQVTRSNDDSAAVIDQNQLNQDPTEEEEPMPDRKLEGFTPVEKVDSLQKTDLVEGTGDAVQAGATITLHYTGALANDGTIFESSYDLGQPATFALSGLILGWQEGIPGMKVGGKRRLLIPAAQGYGASGSGTIPPNADLVFDVEVISIGAPQ